MKHTRGIDVSRTAQAVTVLLAADDADAWNEYGQAVIARHAAYEAADAAYDAVTDEAAKPAASAARLEALRTASKAHDAVLAGIVAGMALSGAEEKAAKRRVRAARKATSAA